MCGRDVDQAPHPTAGVSLSIAWFLHTSHEGVSLTTGHKDEQACSLTNVETPKIVEHAERDAHASKHEDLLALGAVGHSVRPPFGRPQLAFFGKDLTPRSVFDIK